MKTSSGTPLPFSTKNLTLTFCRSIHHLPFACTGSPGAASLNRAFHLAQLVVATVRRVDKKLRLLEALERHFPFYAVLFLQSILRLKQIVGKLAAGVLVVK